MHARVALCGRDAELRGDGELLRVFACPRITKKPLAYVVLVSFTAMLPVSCKPGRAALGRICKGGT